MSLRLLNMPLTTSNGIMMIGVRAETRLTYLKRAPQKNPMLLPKIVIKTKTKSKYIIQYKIPKN